MNTMKPIFPVLPSLYLSTGDALSEATEAPSSAYLHPAARQSQAREEGGGRLESTRGAVLLAPTAFSI